jgi:ribonuclease HI
VAAACDGACRVSTGAGGWGYLIRLADGRVIEQGGHHPATTNNRMEMAAALELLRALEGLELPAEGLRIKTDSRYLLNGLSGWLSGWKRRGWRTAEGEPVKNRDLWELLEQAAAALPAVSFVWVKGHNGDPDNEAADRIATDWVDGPQSPRILRNAAEIRGGADPTGSGWDVAASPDEVIPVHLTEWVEGSAVAPELAAANLQSLRGPEVIEALAGDRWDSLGGHAQQYATGAVQRLLRPLEALAEAGGWWCSGLDPLADWAPMAWGQFKADQPRWDAERNRARKYEAPLGVPTRSTWLRVPAAVAQRVADRWGLELPSAVSADSTGAAGAFWRWVATEPRLPVVVTEGAKKAAALLSAGVPAVALPGVDNGAKRTGEKGPDGRRTGPVELLSDLAALPWGKRRAWVLFDWSDSERGRRDVARAARRLGRHLRAAGAVVEVGTCPGPHKGADDHLAAGGTWEQLAAALGPITADPELPHLRRPDVMAAAGQLLEHSAPIPAPEVAPLVAMAAPMGTGKTRSTAAAVADPLANGVPVLNLTHRTSLGRAQSEALGLPWADEAKPGTVERLQGLGLCFDSACPSSGLRINPTDWSGPDGRGPVVVVDEWAQGVEHLLLGTGTAVAPRRVEVLETVGALMRDARQVIASDAQLSGPALQLLEDLTGNRAHLIGSAHRPFAGRRFHCPEGLSAKQANQQARAKLAELIAQGRPFLCWTTAQQAGSKNSAQNLARFHLQQRPEAQVLVIDSEHPDEAARLAADPDGVAAAYDAIYCSPAISSGLSIELQGHFAAVLLLSGGTVAPEHVAQAAARVRDTGCPVWCFAPERSPGDHLRIGSGDLEPAALLRSLGGCERHLLADLIAAGGYDPETNNPGPWLRCWLELAASRNRARLAYSATVRGLCEREGWRVIATTEAVDETQAQTVSVALEGIAEQAQAAEDRAVIEAEPLTTAEAAELGKRRNLSPSDRAKLQRHRIAAAWGLGAADPTPELLEAHRDRRSERGRLGWLLGSLEGRQQVAAHDARRRQQLAPRGRGWAPDLTRELLGHKVAAADALGLPTWLRRGDWFDALDPELMQLHATAEAHRSDLIQALGASPGKRATTTLRALLRACGYRLESRRTGRGQGRAWQYRISPEPLPSGASEARLQLAWMTQLADPGGGMR